MTRHDAILTKLRAFRPRMALTWVSNGELMQPDAGGGDWRRRIHELREDGHVIVMKRDPKQSRLTHWAWLGVKRESKAERDAEQFLLGQPNLRLITVWENPTPHTSGLFVGYSEYRTSDHLIIMVEKTHTQAGGILFIAHDPGTHAFP